MEKGQMYVGKMENSPLDTVHCTVDSGGVIYNIDSLFQSPIVQREGKGIFADQFRERKYLNMDSDSTSNAAIPASSKDTSNKNKANSLSELKESKISIRREESLVKDTGSKEDSNKSSSSLTVLVTEEENSLLGTSKSRAKGLDIEKSSISDVNMGPHMGSPLGSSNTSICSSGGVSEAEEDSNDCLDDWEAFADALAADEKLQGPPIYPPAGPETGTHVDHVSSSKNSGAQTNSRAWRPNDTTRPRCLPNLLKQHNIRSTCETINWAWKSIMPRPTSCPICYEDFDLTDSSFLPCPCGFRLCLFCHKRILEADERCPGCRRPYEVRNGDVRMCRSFSVSAKYQDGSSSVS